jgi:uncharacterized membrane protein
MVFSRRKRSQEPHPAFVAWRVGLFFLAAGLWVAGVIAGDDRIIGAAIVILVVAILLRLFAGRARPPEEEPELHD